MEKQYRNLGFIFLLFIPLTFFGFYKTYFVLAPEFEGTVDIYTHVHAFTASLWITLLIVQPLLIRYKNFKLHRIFGKVSYVVFSALILSFLPQMVKQYSSGSFPINASLDVILLILFYVLAMRNKKNVTIHMRYMIAIALIFVGPTLGRIIYLTLDSVYLRFLELPYLLVNALLIGLIFWDKAAKRNYKPYLVALGCFMIYLAILYLFK
ncbi:hypothetical protein [Spongiimicrobium sp. 3-5]|uniref:hypothetical protein n=1 Tax=Spongiimicrobium sp. 3-5 TaxID=3332596 RepID=UPI00397FE459